MQAWNNQGNQAPARATLLSASSLLASPKTLTLLASNYYSRRGR